ncbi:histidine phosphatase family protein [Sphingomonas rubra]|uniref:Broad specificity phosphatase PhoE n=1 Tax=Sphingomonas rubra TaxID=634430 RepID=A0A1I5TM79_9SPHN|nr:histidine phosphatase family protein [Sphingomonas rubra]SFP83446.1 Broad specificity phosphatase PhoE [Sphingomonas rubra]
MFLLAYAASSATAGMTWINITGWKRLAATFLLIRHAAHIHLDRIFSGRMAGVPLSEAGEAQAARLGRALAGTAIDLVAHSPLDRTRETAEAIAAAQNGAPALVAVDDLIEIDLGEWTGRPLGSFDDEPAWTAWNARRGSARIPGGETMAEAQGRIVRALATLAAAHDGRTVAVVSHADMIRGAVAHVLGLPLDHLLRFDVDPASVSRLVWGDWGARMMSLNEKVGE